MAPSGRLLLLCVASCHWTHWLFCYPASSTLPSLWTAQVCKQGRHCSTFFRVTTYALSAISPWILASSFFRVVLRFSIFETGSCSAAWLAVNSHSSCLSLPSSWDYRCAPPRPSLAFGFYLVFLTLVEWLAKEVCGFEISSSLKTT
jgi:hypothetical protein